MALPIFQDTNRNIMLMQTAWAGQLNTILKNPLLSGLLLKGVDLVVGSNVINHKLDRMQQGWFTTDQQEVATIYRTQDFNSKTLTLYSDLAVTVDLYVF